MGRNSYRTIEEALALEARLKKREAFKQAEAEALAVAAGKKPGSKAQKPAKPGSAGAGEVRIIGGQWRRTRLAVAQRPGLRPRPIACVKRCSTGWAKTWGLALHRCLCGHGRFGL